MSDMIIKSVRQIEKTSKKKLAKILTDFTKKKNTQSQYHSNKDLNFTYNDNTVK